MNVEYDASHKASSVTSTTSNASSFWDPLPSLYTGRADSVSSAYEFDDLQEPESFEGFNYDTYHRLQLLHHQKEEETLVAAANSVNASTTDSIVVAESEQGNISELLNSFFKEQGNSPAMKKEQGIDHEVSSSIDSSHGNKRKRLSSPSEEEQQQQQNRELLSDDQKRANHIASEQKRRNTIRGGFKELTEIIPTLKNINNSKSTILFKSVDYIKQLDKRNKSLKERLALLQARVQQKQQKRNPVLIAQKNQQKQLELLQEQLRIQQALLTKHNIPLYGYHNSISIPALDDTPVASTTTSPTLQHASLPSSSSIVNNIHLHHHSSSSSAALVMPADDHSSAPSFSIPADDYHPASSNNNTFRERLLSSGKLNHLRRDSYML